MTHPPTLQAAHRRRAALLARLREQFTDRGFTEVHTPRVDPEAIPEAHIDLFEVPGLGYLQASPEMHLKRLLCGGAGPIFEIATCFRAGERGDLHRPEFTMVEWYRPADDMAAGMRLLEEVVCTLLDAPPARYTSYAEAFETRLGWNPHTAPLEVLRAAADEPLDDRDELLNLILVRHVEPELGRDAPEIVYHYPASQSALAKIACGTDGILVAERFELFYRGVELANGYHELTDPVELRQRSIIANEQRRETHRPPLPLPELLLAAMEHPGLPDCAGVALGFDRLLMLAVGAESLDQLP